ncbi:hypothetical protein ACF0H5_004597 [Mactra antiquata]
MTPPLSVRRSQKGLRSPHSSPNLSIRSTLSSAPIIKIDDVVDSPPGSLEHQHSASLSDCSDTGSSPQKVFQLPPVNTWVPKGESLFTSILDQRSPQVYRRTNANSTKTASFPPTAQSLSPSQGSRVSWPQESQTSPISEPVTPTRCVSDISSDESPKSPSASKSPRLLRKCTSFDLERSKPFPARSIMKSPMNLCKGMSLEETGHTQADTKDFSKFTDYSNVKIKESSRITHKEEDEFKDEVDGFTSPNFQSNVDSQLVNKTIDSLAVGTSGLVKCSPSSNEAPNVSSEPIKTVKSNVSWSLYDLKDKDIKHVDIDIEKSSEPVSCDSHDKVKMNESSEADFNVNTNKNKDPGIKKKDIDIKESPKVKSKVSDKTTKTVKTGQSEKMTSKTSAAAVKSALLTSAAKLKPFGRKSPVTLLSYKSKSISIPDQSRRPSRPSSTSELDPTCSKKRSKVHQTESSPTVLVADLADIEVNKEEIKASRIKKSDSAVIVKSESKKDSPRLSAAKSVLKPVLRKTTVEENKPASENKKEKSVVCSKQLTSKSAKSSPSNVTTKKELSAQKPSQVTKSSVTVAPKAVPESSAMKRMKKTVSKSETPSPKPDKTKVKPTKRGSVSSVNSDSAKVSDHFRDCCHGRRRTTDKK